MRIGWLGVAGIQIGTMAQLRIRVRTYERTEVDAIADGRGKVPRLRTPCLEALFLGNIRTNGFEGHVHRAELRMM